jgi:serine/threonine protein kinase
MGSSGGPVTFIGTQGYIAPEGPGTPAADVYSLGVVLYEAATGLDRTHFPAFGADATGSGDPRGLEFQRVIARAVEFNPNKRLEDAVVLNDALQRLAKTHH